MMSRVSDRIHDDEPDTTEATVRALLYSQCPQWADLALAYDQFWWDRGGSIGRTSLIIDPQGGRLPPLRSL